MDSEVGFSRRAVLGGVAAAVAGGGCLASDRMPGARASDWPQRGYDASGTNFKTSGDPPLDGAAVAWRSTPLDWWSRVIPPTPLLADGSVYCPGGQILDLADGRVAGRTDCVSQREGFEGFARTRTYADGVLLATGADRGSDSRTFDSPSRSLHGFRPSLDTGPTGRCANAVRWTVGAPQDADVTVGPVTVSGDRVLAVTYGGDSVLRSVRPEDGRAQWQLSLKDAPPDRPRRSPWHTSEWLLADRDRVYLYAPSPDEGEDVFLVVDRQTRERLVERRPEWSGWLHAVRDGTAYVTEYQKVGEDDQGDPDFSPVLTAIDAETGRSRWAVNLQDALGSDVIVSTDSGVYQGGIDGIAVGPEAVFAHVDERVCLALSTADGHVRWRREIDSAGGLVATDRAVYLPTLFAGLVCLDASTGETRWRAPFDSASTVGKPVIGDRRLIVPVIPSSSAAAARGTKQSPHFVALEEA